MKTKIILLAIPTVLIISSCRIEPKIESPKKQPAKTVEQKLKAISADTIQVLIYDNCEYIIYKEEKDINSAFGFMAHKGNCSNSIHKN